MRQIDSASRRRRLIGADEAACGSRACQIAIPADRVFVFQEFDQLLALEDGQQN